MNKKNVIVLLGCVLAVLLVCVLLVGIINGAWPWQKNTVDKDYTGMPTTEATTATTDSTTVEDTTGDTTQGTEDTTAGTEGGLVPDNHPGTSAPTGGNDQPITPTQPDNKPSTPTQPDNKPTTPTQPDADPDTPSQPDIGLDQGNDPVTPDTQPEQTPGNTTPEQTEPAGGETEEEIFNGPAQQVGDDGIINIGDLFGKG